MDEVSQRGLRMQTQLTEGVTRFTGMCIELCACACVCHVDLTTVPGASHDRDVTGGRSRDRATIIIRALDSLAESATSLAT